MEFYKELENHYLANDLSGTIALFEASFEQKLNELSASANLVGACYVKNNDIVNAYKCLTKACELNKNNAEAYNNLGVLFGIIDKNEDAIKTYMRALELNPIYAEAANNLGILYAKMNQNAEAIFYYQMAISSDENYANPCNNLASLYQSLDRYDEAEIYYKKAILQDCNYADAYNNYATMLKDIRRYEESKILHLRAIEICPTLIPAYNNIGNLYWKMHDTKNAINCFLKAIELDNNYISAYVNLAAIYGELNEFEKSQEAYAKAFEIDIYNADARFNFSLLLLKIGELEAGFKYYEARLDKKEQKKPNLPFDMWQGEDLNNKSILVLCEQGFGDDIQFARYLPILKNMGAKITFVCKKETIRLFGDNLDIDIIAENDCFGLFDYWIFLMSLPCLLGTNLNNIPLGNYLSANQESVIKYKKLLPNNQKIVGIAINGSKQHKNDSYRSISDISALKKLFDMPNIKFVNLCNTYNKDLPSDVLQVEINDFCDLAGLIQIVDLVISVDTAVVHLAGTLGKHTFLMLSNIAYDWRWMIDTSESPWYPSIKIFRQSISDSWTEVVLQVSDEMKAYFGLSCLK